MLASLHHFPFPIHHENEVPYLTRAVGIVTDEKNNVPHAAHYRFMVKRPFDTDIDIENPAQMAWALATRVQADRDLVILPGMLGTDLDLSAPAEGVLTKVGIDATAKPFRKNLPPVAGIPEAVMKRIDLKEYIPNMKEYL
jgi:3-polyprenyl-4-hydroxybenzoate decarboxylase